MCIGYLDPQGYIRWCKPALLLNIILFMAPLDESEESPPNPQYPTVEAYRKSISQDYGLVFRVYSSILAYIQYLQLVGYSPRSLV